MNKHILTTVALALLATGALAQSRGGNDFGGSGSSYEDLEKQACFRQMTAMDWTKPNGSAPPEYLCALDYWSWKTNSRYGGVRFTPPAEDDYDAWVQEWATARRAVSNAYAEYTEHVQTTKLIGIDSFWMIDAKKGYDAALAKFKAVVAQDPMTAGIKQPKKKPIQY